MKIERIVKRQVSKVRGAYILTAQLESTKKWIVLGRHEWVEETTDSGFVRKVLAGPYPETVRRVMKEERKRW